MSDGVDKLTLADVRALVTRANSPSPGPALATQNTLREAVNAGEAAFNDQGTFTVAQRAVEGLLDVEQRG